MRCGFDICAHYDGFSQKSSIESRRDRFEITFTRFLFSIFKIFSLYNYQHDDMYGTTIMGVPTSKSISRNNIDYI